jgi:hypothetical protein
MAMAKSKLDKQIELLNPERKHLLAQIEASIIDARDNGRWDELLGIVETAEAMIAILKTIPFGDEELAALEAARQQGVELKDRIQKLQAGDLLGQIIHCPEKGESPNRVGKM